MSGSQPSVESASTSAGAASAAGGDQDNCRAKNAGDGLGHTGVGSPNQNNWRQNNSMKYNSRPWNREESGHYKHRAWSNYNSRHSPYRRNNNTHYENRRRQERDYTQRTDYHTRDYHERRERSGERELDRSPRKSRNPEESYRSSGRHRDHHYRDQNLRYQNRRSEENRAKSPIHNDSIGNESSSHPSRTTDDTYGKINESPGLTEAEPNCLTDTEASKVEHRNNKSPTKKPNQNNKNKPSKVVAENNIKAKKINAIYPSTVAAQNPTTDAPKYQKPTDSESNITVSSESNHVNGLNEDSNSNACKAHNIVGTSPNTDLNGKDSDSFAPKDLSPTISKCQKDKSNLSKDGENISTADASQLLLNSPRIQVRPLTQLLKQEIIAVTKENRLNQGPTAAISSPCRPTFKPFLRHRHRTVSSSQNGAGPSQFAESEAIINNRIAGMDKQSLKYIINNSDTIYDEHLKNQARKRLREEIRRQLKAIELDQPKNTPVTELVEDEIVDAIKLPELLLKEIEKCFGKDFIEGQVSHKTEENQNSCKAITGTEISDENSQQDMQPSEESATNVKDSKPTKDREQSNKNSEHQSNEQTFTNESENNNNQNKLTEEESIENDKTVRAASEIIQDDSEKNDYIFNKRQEILDNRKKRRALRSQRKIEYKMKRAQDLMSRQNAADEVKRMAKKRMVNKRGPLLPTPPGGRIPNNFDFRKDQDISEVQSPEHKTKDPNIFGSESVTAAVKASPEIIAPLNTSEDKTDRSFSPIRKRISNLSKPNDQNIRKSPSPKQTSMTTNNKSSATSPDVIPSLNTIIKSEYSTSPVRVSFVPKGVIELLSSSEDDDGEENCPVDMELDEPKEKPVNEIDNQIMELAPEPDHASDHSTSSHCSNESAKRRFKLKLQSDAENVVDSFEKLILPNLRETLSDRYHLQHSGNLRNRLLFISCVVTSSEHNPKTFSKIEVAKIQKNLKAPDNREGVQFLLREIVSVVNLQKQRRREQEWHMTLNGFSPTNEEQKASVAKEIPKASTPHSSNHSSPLLSIDQSPSTLPGLQSPLPMTSPVSQSLLAVHEIPPAFPAAQNPQTYSVGLSIMTMNSNDHGSAQLRSWPDIGEPFGQIRSQLSQNIAEIDRHIMENQNRRSLLEEMIAKFQKEKSDLEMLNLQLQSRKIMLMISSNQPVKTAPTPTAVSSNLTPRGSSSQEPKQEENMRQTRSKTRFRLVKVIPKRVKQVLKRVTKKRVKAEELIAHLQQDQEQNDQEQLMDVESMLDNQSDIREEFQDESICDHTSDSVPTVKPKPSPLSKPKASVSQQPLAIIPPLPPPPPPPEPICYMSDELQTEYEELNSQHNQVFIPPGMLRGVVRPITQLRIFKEFVIAAAEDGDIYMFHLFTHKLERKITKHSDAITNMFLCEKDSILYTTSLDGFFKKTSLENLERVMQTVYFKEPLQSIDIAWEVAFVGTRWGNVFTYNVKTNKQADMSLLSTGQSIFAIKATKEGVRRILILGCKGCSIYMNDAGNGLLLRHLSVASGQNIYSLLLSDGHIYCGTQKNQIYKFEFVTGNLVAKLNCGNGAVSIVSYKERYVLAGCYDGYIYVLDKMTGKQVGRFEAAGRLVLALAVAGDKIVTSSKDNSLGILEVPAAMVSGQ